MKMRKPQIYAYYIIVSKKKQAFYCPFIENYYRICYTERKTKRVDFVYEYISH